MNRIRWKMMIGGLGLALGGLAAVAGVPATTGMVSCAGTPTHTVARVGDPPAPTPKAAPAPAPAGPDVPALPDVPSFPPAIPAHAPAPVAIPLPATPEPIAVAPAMVPAPVMILPTPVPPPTLPTTPAVAPTPPMLPTPVTVPVPIPPSISEFRVPAPVGLQTTFMSGAVPAPVLAEPIAPKPAFPPIPVGLPEAQPTFIVTGGGVLRGPAAKAAEPVKPVELAKPPEPSLQDRLAPTNVSPTPAAPERKLKVILSMGDERPRFEVRDGDEVYLKVVCDKVEVKSPGEGGVSVSTMRASGKVTFVTPGGEGTCDELAVLPGTGQVVVTGKVSFTYNWGKVETTVTGEKMNFRLGSNAMTPTTSSVGVPVGYR